MLIYFDLFRLSNKTLQFTLISMQITQITNNNKVRIKFMYNHMVEKTKKLSFVFTSNKSIDFHSINDYTCNLTVKTQLNHFLQFSFDSSENAESDLCETNTKLPIYKCLMH